MKFSLKDKTGRVNANVIKGLIVSLIMATVLFSVMTSVVPTAASSFNDLATNLSDSAIYGTAPAAFASNLTTYVGWFWVIAPFILAVTLVLAVLKYRR